MIVYSSTKLGFLHDVLTGDIDKTILTSFVREMGHSTGKSELKSWRNSMPYMSNILSDPELPDDVGVAVEYKIPQTTKRIDFIITGKNADRRKTAILIELKQWSEGISISDKDAVVNTNFFGECNHPSYQAWTYAALLEDYNENVQEQNIKLTPCAYLHNYPLDGVIRNSFYKEHTDKAPVFLKNDALKLREFINKHVKYGDNRDVLYAIEHGKIRPSKALADSLAKMLEGNQEFLMIDDQKIVYETALKLAKESRSDRKNVLIIEGGPGTGKSVVAINLLIELTNRKQVVQYVTKNSAPREVYQVKLSGKFSKTRISNLFSSSGSFWNIDNNTFDALIVDEAHRLNEKSGLFSNLGENQIGELIAASKLSIFFVDENQRVTMKDIGQKTEIEKWATKHQAKIHHLTLESQFRCNGSDGYLAWLDDVLGIRQTANDTLEGIDFDFRVTDTPQALHDLILAKNNQNKKSRVVAGYCWNWISKRNPLLKDIVIGDYQATWNLDSHGQAWIAHPDSVTEVGCIHTCQGLDLDYVGVIIGKDFVIRGDEIVTDANNRASSDQSIKGLKSLMKSNPIKAKASADMIIKNTYKTLMTRGMKGCYIYCTDPETQTYFKNRIQSNIDNSSQYADIPTGISVNTDATTCN